MILQRCTVQDKGQSLDSSCQRTGPAHPSTIILYLFIYCRNFRLSLAVSFHRHRRRRRPMTTIPTRLARAATVSTSSVQQRKRVLDLYREWIRGVRSVFFAFARSHPSTLLSFPPLPTIGTRNLRIIFPRRPAICSTRRYSPPLREESLRVRREGDRSFATQESAGLPGGGELLEAGAPCARSSVEQ